ncbi:MAG: hypothetical protein C4321_08215, partial [Chloroflexota bacterium]
MTNWWEQTVASSRPRLGGLRAMAGQLDPLGEVELPRLRAWVEVGGTYIGTCAGSCHPLRMSDPYREALPLAARFQMCEV